jgi:hypothetical protein
MCVILWAGIAFQNAERAVFSASLDRRNVGLCMFLMMNPGW